MDVITGTVDRFLYKNDENSFSVFVVHLGKDQMVVVKGHAPSLQPGSSVEIHGSWIVHPKFGKQFEASTISVALPKSTLGLKKYLGSGIIKGIGKSYAEKLVDFFGSDVLDIIEHQPEKLSKVSGIGPKRIEQITKGWVEQKEIATVMIFLQEKGASSSYAAKIYKQYGANAITIMTENPYRIAQEIWGIGFKTADAIAQNLGFTKESIKRIKAGILFTISQETGNGHLYVELDNLKKETATLLELSLGAIKDSITNGLHELYQEKQITLLTHQEKHYITLPQYYWTEKSVAQKIIALQNCTLRTFDTSDIYKLLQTKKEREVELNELQQEGILRAIDNKVSIVTGGPGTGKTTLVKKLLQILDEKKISYKLAAPTGRAAKRITESTGKYAETLHRLLEFNPQIMGFTHNEQNALKLDILIVDEASMIDIFLAHAILKAMPLTAHILFLGDIDQLPSVGAGNFLYDLIASKKIPLTRLHYIFRQAENSLITYNAHRINRGEFPESRVPQTIQDYFFIREELPENLPIHLKKIFEKTLPSWHISQEKSIILSPMNRGTAGTQNINHILQNLLNPDPVAGTLQKTFYTFKMGDRVMQIKNNYDKHVFNGDIGTIATMSQEDKTITVAYAEKDVIYDFLETDELILAYAISIHKSQGSEFDAVIIPIFTQHFTLLQKNLIYTAITRAKKICIIIGQVKALAMAIKNTKSSVRNTFLSTYLTTDLQCR
jgi:exodeoxyribonuclease V alpha subunit